MNELIGHLPSLGIAGLLFVMWWYERLERVRGRDTLGEATRSAAQLADMNDRLLDVLRDNTAALTGLREEFRSQRMTQTELLARICQRLEAA